MDSLKGHNFLLNKYQLQIKTWQKYLREQRGSQGRKKVLDARARIN